MQASVPADIWYYVARFLTEDELRTLSTVNLIFFTVALDARYQRVTLYLGEEPPRKSARALLERLRDPTIATRVRHLCLDFGSEPPKEQQSAIVSTPFLTIISSLTQITNLTVICNWYGAATLALYSGDQQQLLSSVVLPAIRTLTKTCSISLHTLTLRANVDVLGMLAQSTMYLPVLEQLCLHIDVRQKTPTFTRFQDIAQTLGSRFSRVRRLLISTVCRLEISFLFPSLGQFPRLEELSVELQLRMKQMELGRLTRFISNNPSIKALHFNGKGSAPLTTEDAHWFIDSLSQLRDGANGFSSLKLPLRTVTPHLVHAFAGKFPTLHELILVAGTVRGDFDVNGFQTELRQYTFSRWVHDITIMDDNDTVNLLASLAVAETSYVNCRIRGHHQDYIRIYLNQGGDSFIAHQKLARLSIPEN